MRLFSIQIQFFYCWGVFSIKSGEYHVSICVSFTCKSPKQSHMNYFTNDFYSMSSNAML